MENVFHFRICVAAFALACLLSGCGSSKTAAPGGTEKGTDKNFYGLEIKLNECQELAEESPVTRAWGEGLSTRLSFAKTYAEGQARAALVRTIAPIIKTASEENGIDYSKASSSATEGAIATDEGAKGNQITTQIAEAVVENAVVIKTNQYMQPNRQYHVFVCVEYMGGSSAMARNISDNVKQRVSDEERMKMNYDFQKFEEKVRAELDKKNAQRR